MDVPLECITRLYQKVTGRKIRHRNSELAEKIEGVDSLFSIPDLLDRHEAERPLVVTGPNVSKTTFFESFINDRETGYVVYHWVRKEPTVSQAEEIAAFYEKNDCDSFIAIGGGSAIDAAKAAAACIARPGKKLQKMRGLMHVRHDTPFFIAVPTTAGTGSETTANAALIDNETGQKFSIIDPHLMPDVAVLDPSLLISLPQDETAYTGMDALTHAVEAYLNTPYHLSDTAEDCEDAVEAIMESLPKAYADGEDLQAREEMLIASYTAGTALNVSGYGNIHALAHAISRMLHMQHGLINAVVMPYVLREYGAAVVPELAKLASVSDIEKDGTRQERAAGFIKAVEDMNEDMGIPKHLDISESDFPKIATWAYREVNPIYPVPVIFDKKRFIKILRQIASK
ncbi:MAG: iron-containing alcohol dehydrogenase [Lachnospiraceae bacterium]|uniref:Iron-containing alcohol dehydrogenase n=1 Tax=Candidatus Weimeria bifida TaxID=2599074 RepID=A0A6N7J0T9_9FIRM|nr:iron-containing alcohol dehydrogenase [Candidatus Weimeria bifida]RRF94818.1 MAG: iron-containing alcohol dehydrogenase [Lachnospiraceae bacterium]